MFVAIAMFNAGTNLEEEGGLFWKLEKGALLFFGKWVE